MLESLINIDHSLFEKLHLIGHPFLDQFMFWMSNKFIWIPLYLFLILRLYQQYGKKFVVPLIAALVVVLINDQLTSSLMKPFFERLRPCNDPQFADMIQLVGRCPSGFSFASGHAANSFGVAFFFFLVEKQSKMTIVLLCWAAVVSYSRIYLGVHFPGDVLIGSIIGITSASIIYFLMPKRLLKHI